MAAKKTKNSGRKKTVKTASKRTGSAKYQSSKVDLPEERKWLKQLPAFFKTGFGVFVMVITLCVLLFFVNSLLAGKDLAKFLAFSGFGLLLAIVGFWIFLLGKFSRHLKD